MRSHPKTAISLIATATALCWTAQAQSPAPEAKLERVQVTGTNIKRASAEISSPIDVITAKDIQASGARSTLDLLKMVPALGADGYNDTSTQNGFSKGVATASLRNLSATSTLILLNGRRMTPSAYANPNNGTSTLYDLNSIPLSAIDRVEVFRDGASAVYGSDAVGGVINFITRSDYQGLEIRSNASANDEGRYGRKGINAAAGLGDYVRDGYNLLFSADLAKRDRTMIAEGSEDIPAADYRAINLRLGPFGSSFTRSPFFTRERSPGARAFPQTTPSNVINRLDCPAEQQIVGGAEHGITTQPLLGRRFCNYDVNRFNEAENKGTDASLMTRGVARLGSGMQAFGEFTYSRSERSYLSASRTISGLSPTTSFVLGGLAPSYQPILEVGHPDNPFSDARAAVQLRFEDIAGGSKLVNQGYRAVAGVKGTAFGNWDWETAVLWNRSDRDETLYGFLRLPVLRQLLGAPGPNSGRSLASIAADPDLSRPLLNQGSAAILQWDAKVAGEVGKLPGGAIGLAAGVEVRRETMDIDPDPANAAGEVLGLATTAVHGKRNVSSAYVEARTPFFKGFEMDFAGRWDKYQGQKINFVPKVGAKWQLNKHLTLRGTYSEGFRAPAVSQVTPGGAQFFLNNLRDPVRCNVEATPPVPKPGAENADCAKSVSGVGGANPALRNEHSRSKTIGFILSPVDGLDLLVDYYNIIKIGEVALGSAQDVIDHPDRYPPTALVRDTNPLLLLDGQPGTGPLLTVATPWTNQGSTEVSGLDIELRTAATVAGGARWTNALRAHYALKYDRVEHEGFAHNNLVGTRGGLSDFATSAGDIPRLKFRFTSTLETRAHRLLGAVNFVSGVSLIRRTDGSEDPPVVYEGVTCHYGGPLNDPRVGSRSNLGAPPTATNGRDLYINRYPNCAVDSWMTFDAGYTYIGFKNLTLGLHIANITDAKAPYDPTGGVIGHNSGLHNSLGRYFTVSASYKFK